MDKDVSIVIPVYNGGETFKKCLELIKSQSFHGQIDIVVVDSGSTDGSMEVAKRAGASISCIENKDYHHSRTRNNALQRAKFERVVYLVQDAVPVSENWLSQLCATLDREDVASASVRQIPHADADVSARFEVEYHGKYLGDKPYLKHIASCDTFAHLPYDEALHVIRHDNVCSIYRRNLLERYPFPDVDFAEDMAWARSMLLMGYKILYDPRIMVKHSHNRPPEYRFRRSVVDSIACAKILGRVKEDISYLNVRELLMIRENLEGFANELKKQLIAQAGLRLKYIDTVRYYFLSRKYAPFLKKMHQLLANITCLSKKNAHTFPLQQLYCDHIRFVMTMITGGYSLVSVHDYSYCVDQITATILGRLYGELYSGYMLKGAVPREVDDLVRPFLDGV